MDENLIKHRGVISEINSQSILVNIIAESACAACHAKGVCGVADMKEKIIEVKNSGKIDQKVGDFVVVTMNRNLGIQAVVYGYFIPFILLMITLIVSLSYMDSQGMAGILSLLILAPYYLVLYFFRHKLKNRFDFQIENSNSTNKLNFNTTQK
jgi:sigma-E factor negative regulatory protein RseC